MTSCDKIADFAVVKRDTRLWIVDAASGAGVYTPPDFLRKTMTSRTALQALAARAREEGCLSIAAIIDFETGLRPDAAAAAA